MADEMELIRRNGNDTVNAYDDACVFHQAIGDSWDGTSRGVVYKSVYKEFAISFDNTSKKAIVQAGYGQLYGREFRIPTGKSYSTSPTTTSSVYILIYISIAITSTSETGEIKSLSGSSQNISIGNTDIYKSQTGTATMPLYTVYWNASSNTWSLIKDWRHIREPGVAESALSMSESGVINGNKVSDLVEYGTGYAKLARYADEAGNATAIGPTGYSNKIDSHLCLTDKQIYLISGKEVSGYASTLTNGSSHKFTWDAPTGTIIGYSVNIEATVGGRTLTAAGFIAAEQNSFYCTNETAERTYQPWEGIRFDSTDGCWAECSATSTGLSVKAMKDLTYLSIKVGLVVAGV